MQFPRKLFTIWTLILMMVMLAACSNPAPTSAPPTDAPTQPVATELPTETPSPVPTETPTEMPSPTATFTWTPTPTETETATPTETLTPTPEDTATPTVAPVVPQITISGGINVGYVYLNIDIVDFSPNTQFIINVVYEGGKKTWEITGKADENGIYQYFGYLSKFNANKEGPGYYGTYVITIEGEDGFYSQQTLLISK